MKPRTAGWLLGVFLVAFLAVGVPYWSIPERKLEVPTSLMGAGLLVVGVGAALARAVGGLGFGWSVLAAGAAVPAVVMARVVADTAKDPTSHNLWPFEVVIAVFVGGFAAVVGALLGSVASWVRRQGS